MISNLVDHKLHNPNNNKLLECCLVSTCCYKYFTVDIKTDRIVSIRNETAL